MGSPKVIFELPGAHVGASEGHFGVPECDVLSPRVDSELRLLLAAVLWDHFLGRTHSGD